MFSLMRDIGGITVGWARGRGIGAAEKAEIGCLTTCDFYYCDALWGYASSILIFLVVRLLLFYMFPFYCDRRLVLD